MADSPRVATAKRLLDTARRQGFEFRRIAPGPDGALLGTRRAGEWVDTLYLGGFSRDCYAVRERTSSLVVPGAVLVERRATGDALNVLNAVLTWPT